MASNRASGKTEDDDVWISRTTKPASKAMALQKRTRSLPVKAAASRKIAYEEEAEPEEDETSLAVAASAAGPNADDATSGMFAACSVRRLFLTLALAQRHHWKFRRGNWDRRARRWRLDLPLWRFTCSNR